MIVIRKLCFILAIIYLGTPCNAFLFISVTSMKKLIITIITLNTINNYSGLHIFIHISKRITNHIRTCV